MRHKFYFLILFFILFSIIPATAQKIGHITLLAVSEATQIGSTADLYLRIQEGSGGIYIDTFPLTKLDTQLSTRFAQQIACDFIEEECTDKDFFYTIRSDATIIGGPSAGAALATLTVAMLDDHVINESVAITGTINVGGLIGPVGSLVGKIDAAKTNGMTKVLIPKGSRYEPKPEVSYNERLMDAKASFYRTNNETNSTEIDLYAYGNNISVEVKEVGTLQEAVYEITGIWYDANEKEIVPEEWYTERMKEIADDLCGRTRTLLNVYEEMEKNETKVNTTTLYEETLNATIRAENATAYGQHYVAASTCFGNNIRVNYISHLERRYGENKTNETIEYAKQINQTIANIEKDIEQRNLRTITDLQTYLVVNERVQEAKDTLNELYINIAIALQNDAAYQIAYAIERLYSAKAWSTFFENDDKELALDNEALEETCVRKISEAQERYQYVRLMTTEQLDAVTRYLDRANEEYEHENYILCMDIASRAKANLDIILSLVGVRDEKQLIELVDERLRLVRQVINRQQEKGYFPMLAYSYYEYASFLKEKDPYSALIYSHYALEFSHLDVYFKEKEIDVGYMPDQENILYLIFGFGIGVLFSGLLLFQRKKN
jgi:uncharacterized protein